MVPGYIARAAGANADRLQRVLRGCQQLGILIRAEIIIAAPNGDLVSAVVRVTLGQRILPDLTREFGEYAIAPFGLELTELAGKNLVVFPGEALPRFEAKVVMPFPVKLL